MRWMSWSIPFLLVGCGNDVSLGGPNTLVRVDSEPAGINCPDGGVAINTGTDTNGDGYLGDDEIKSTQYVCNGVRPVQCDGGTVHAGTLTITKDAELASLSGVNCVDGDLLITGLTMDHIPTLALGVVTGDLVVAGNAKLTSLGGLATVHAIGDTLLVEANPLLRDLTGIARLDRVRMINVTGNDGLTDLHGLESLTTIGSHLVIANNANLVSLDGLENLTATSANIYIQSNPSLVSVDALAQLRSVYLFEIDGNAALPSIDLTALEHVTERLIINTNSAMTTFRAPALTSVGDFTQFNGDGALTTIDLPSLLSAGSLIFTSNASLTTINAGQLGFVAGGIGLYNLPVLRTLDFSSVTTTSGLTIDTVSQLASLATFSRMSLVAGDLVIQHADALHSLTGLDLVTAIGGDMRIMNNQTLSSLTGMSKLTEVNGDLTISANPALSLTTARSFASRLTVHGTVTVN